MKVIGNYSLSSYIAIELLLMKNEECCETQAKLMTSFVARVSTLMTSLLTSVVICHFALHSH